MRLARTGDALGVLQQPWQVAGCTIVWSSWPRPLTSGMCSWRMHGAALTSDDAASALQGGFQSEGHSRVLVATAPSQ